MSKQEITDEELLKEKSEFDNYFQDFEGDYVIKLYEYPANNKRRKEWVQDFYNQIPDEEYIATEYREAGHYWAMSTKKGSGIVSKNIFISQKSIDRILRQKAETNPVGTLPIAPGAPPVESVSDKLIAALITAIPGMLAAKNQPPTQMDQFGAQMEKMQVAFMDNMKTVNDYMLNQSKKLATERLADKPAEEEESGGTWIKDLIESFKPLLDSFLNAEGIEAGLYQKEIDKNTEYQAIIAKQEHLQKFYDELVETVGEEKADEFMIKMGHKVNPTPGENGKVKENANRENTVNTNS